MGKIEFVGIINDFFDEEKETQENTIIPEDAHLIKDENWVDMTNQLNWFIVSVPIFVIILILMVFKQRKNGIFNKEIRKEHMEKNNVTDKRKMLSTVLKRFFSVVIIFLVALIITAPIHELLHCIAGALSGLDMKFGFAPINFMAFAYTEDPLTKMQFLVMSLTPLVVLAIIPLIILFVRYPKEKVSFKKGLKYWILACFIGTIVITCSPDILQSYNFIKHIPNNAIVQENYWYIPKDN